MFKETGNSYIISLIFQLEEIKQANYLDLLTYTNEFSALIKKLPHRGNSPLRSNRD